MSRALALALLLALGCTRPIEGEPVAGPVAEWSAVVAAPDLELATAGGRRFRTVLARPFVHEGSLHLHVYTIFDASDAGLAELLDGGRLDLRAAGRVYALRAVRLTTAAEIEPLLPTLARQMKLEVVNPRWDPAPARYPGTQVRQWLFRLEPASR